MDSSFIEPTTVADPVLPIDLNPSVFRPFAYRVLSKKYGLNVQSTALEKLASYVGRRFGTKWKRDPKTSAFLDAVAKIWKEQGRGIFIDGSGINQVIKEIIANEQRTAKKQQLSKLQKQKQLEDGFENGDANDSAQFDPTYFDSSTIISSQSMDNPIIAQDELIDWKNYFQVVDVNHYTKFSYDLRRKQFDYSTKNSSSKIIQLPNTDDIINFHITRLDLLRDRIYRNDVFSKLKYDSLGQSKFSNQTHRPKYITAIKNLLGRNEQRFVLFGLVTLNSFGIWQLQDDSDKIELVLKQCIFPTDSYFVSGNFLIVDGFYSSAGKFHVLSVAHPPAEDRTLSLDALANIDFNWNFSKNGKIDLTMKKLTQKEIKLHADHKIVVLGGNLYLDNLEIITKLKKTLEEIEIELSSSLDDEKAKQKKKKNSNNNTLDDNNEDELGGEEEEEEASNGVANLTITVHDRTVAIIFNGPFTSKALTVTEGSSQNSMTSSGIYKASFDNLATILEQFKNICEHCKLIFVPSDEDPWMSMVTKNSNSIWPHMKIPTVFGTKLTRVAKDVVWASNPCRINYLSQDIAIMRDDIGEAFRRNDFSYLCELNQEEIDKAMRHNNNVNNNEENLSQISLNSQNLAIDRLTAKETGDEFTFKKISKTLLDQGILSPFVYKTRQILPNYWPLLSLLPLPDTIIISDTSSPSLSTMYKGCLVSNVGQFYENSHGNYLEYYPSSQTSKLRTVY